MDKQEIRHKLVEALAKHDREAKRDNKVKARLGYRAILTDTVALVDVMDENGTDYNAEHLIHKIADFRKKFTLAALELVFENEPKD